MKLKLALKKWGVPSRAPDFLHNKGCRSCEEWPEVTDGWGRRFNTGPRGHYDCDCGLEEVFKKNEQVSMSRKGGEK
ncbi:MAG: hypothetical protein Q8K86_05945 [Candidatus Nanopelagicaceae bacterium]|nr:hypothetical protein [Candidatus Nanopelagicaceae bacterium]